MEYLGENVANGAAIYLISRNESAAIRRLACALVKTEKGALPNWPAVIERMNQLAEIIEKGPLKVMFEPVEYGES